MHDAVAVCERQCRCDVDGDVGGAVGVQRTLAAHDLGKAPPLDVLHHDVVGAFVIAPVVHTDHVGLAQVGGSLSLPPESLDER